MTACINTEALVVGGGPAGSVLAARLAEKGIPTIIVDQHHFPRPKPCGGGITERAVQLLDFDLLGSLQESCHLFQSSCRGRNPFTHEGGRALVYTVAREEFDTCLLNRARSRGAEVHEGVRVKTVSIGLDRAEAETDRGTYRARYVVGAGGVECVVARSVKLRAKKRLGRAIVCRLDPRDADEYNRFHATVTMDFGVVPFGYGWVFPAGSHLNVGVFTQKGDLKGLRGFLEQYLSLRFPWCPATDFAGLKTDNHLLPLGGRLEPLHSGRAIIIGDSAGLVDPLTGEGIYHAMRSGQIGAMVIAEALALENPALLSQYTTLVQAEIVRNFRSSRLIGQALYRFPRFVYSMVTHPRIVSGYQASRDRSTLMGEVPYGRVLADFFRTGFFSSRRQPKS